MTIEWGKYQDAYKAIWEKLEENRQKLEALTKALDSLAQDAFRVKTV